MSSECTVDIKVCKHQSESGGTEMTDEWATLLWDVPPAKSEKPLGTDITKDEEINS